ncbi:MAG: hypothetical protein DCC55_17220 [Chloroflexi bacterium]|nr:MAG: hypothetical protein DCC55_17220 [Chloroflexota bacterium]
MPTELVRPLTVWGNGQEKKPCNTGATARLCESATFSAIWTHLRRILFCAALFLSACGSSGEEMARQPLATYGQPVAAELPAPRQQTPARSPTVQPAPGPSLAPTATVTPGALVLLPSPTPRPIFVWAPALGAIVPAPMFEVSEAVPVTSSTPAPLFEQREGLGVTVRWSPAMPIVLAPTPDGIERVTQVPILMYHYLSVPPANADAIRRDLSVEPTLFDQHLARMKEEGYTTINLYDLVAFLHQGRALPEKPVVITFDDGYRDHYENALPLLLKHGMIATFFVVTDFIDEQRPGYLTWEMVRAMHEAGMSIESHGRNHVSLRGKDSDYLVWQALGSLETIEYELGVRPRFISYPGGEYDRLAVEIFRSANYWGGVTTVQGATHTNDNLFELRRVRIRGTTTPDELARLLELDW